MDEEWAMSSPGLDNCIIILQNLELDEVTSIMFLTAFDYVCVHSSNIKISC